MYYFIRLFIFLLCICNVKIYSKNKQYNPKLIVSIVVDQMRWDFLHKYKKNYSKNGFKKILNKGYSYDNLYINYLPSYTAVGHASIYTGTVPSIHGITGNNFIHQKDGISYYCTQDDKVKIIGSDNIELGKRSPRNLLVSTVSDQLKLSNNFKSRVYSISLKDRSAILPGGHFADAAFWYDYKNGKWITSSYYLNKLPSWLEDYNNNIDYKNYIKDWDLLLKKDLYVENESTLKFAEKFSGIKKIGFPYKKDEMFKILGYKYLLFSPFGNSITKDFLFKTIVEENLGKGEYTDFIMISFSSTDYIGHQFSPNSLEIEDTYIRLDRDIADIITFLNKKIGKNKYNIILTADHGAANNPNYIISKKGNAGYIDYVKLQSDINNFLYKKYHSNNLILSLDNCQVTLNKNYIKNNNIDLNLLKSDIVKIMNDVEGVHYVFDIQDINKVIIPDFLRTIINNSYFKDRSGDIFYILKPQWYANDVQGGTTHVTYNSYDSHIPFLIYGGNVKHGNSNNRVQITDIAPTLSYFLNIEEPNGNIGKVLTDFIKNR